MVRLPPMMNELERRRAREDHARRVTDAEDQPSDDSRPVPNGVSFLDRALVVVFVISLAIGALLFLVAQIQPG